MQELRLVAVSEDGTYLVLATAGRGTRFTLPVDDRLRAAVRGHFSRLGQFEIEVESPLRPKEIQARIRSGETAEEIAESAGIPVERVRWFEGPVLQEREYMAQQAQRVTIRRPGESTPGPPLGETVEERLGRGGVDLDEVEWDSWKCEDGTWRVRLSFFDNGRPHAAEWTFDPRRRHVFPLDEIAARLTAVEWDDDTLSDTVTPLVPRRPAMKVVSSDRDPAARGLPAGPEQPGAHGVLRPAEHRERAEFRELPGETGPAALGEPGETASFSGPSLETREDAGQSRFREVPRHGGPAPVREDGEAVRPEEAHGEHETAQAADKAGEDEKPAASVTAEPQAAESRTAETDRLTETSDDGVEERETAVRKEVDGERHDGAEADLTADAPGDRETARAPEKAEETERPASTETAEAATTEATTETAEGASDRGEAAGERETAAETGTDTETDTAGGEERPAEATVVRDTAREDDEDAESADKSRAETADKSRAETADESGSDRFAETPARRAARARAAEREPRREAPADGGAREAEPEPAARRPESTPSEEGRPSRESRPAAQRPAPRQPARPPAKKKPATRPTMPAAQDKPATGSPAAAASAEPAAQRPARRRKSKGKRASVPSWDEIMFGARRPE